MPASLNESLSESFESKLLSDEPFDYSYSSTLPGSLIIIDLDVSPPSTILSECDYISLIRSVT
jgi:hypothetical protein